MKANEMQRYRYQNDFPNDYDGIVDDKDGELVFYEDAMQVIQALEAKIKGMIERPKGELMQWNVDTAEDGAIESVDSDLQQYDGLKVGATMEYDQAIRIEPLFIVVTKTPNYECECDEPCHCDEYDYEEFGTLAQAQERTKALGMEGGE